MRYREFEWVILADPVSVPVKSATVWEAKAFGLTRYFDSGAACPVGKSTGNFPRRATSPDAAVRECEVAVQRWIDARAD